jgi:hypothetical protein
MDSGPLPENLGPGPGGIQSLYVMVSSLLTISYWDTNTNSHNEGQALRTYLTGLGPTLPAYEIGRKKGLEILFVPGQRQRAAIGGLVYIPVQSDPKHLSTLTFSGRLPHYDKDIV